MYNRYFGNTGRVERVGDARGGAAPQSSAPPRAGDPGPSSGHGRQPGRTLPADAEREGRAHAQRPPLPAPSSQRPPSPLSGLSGMVSEILKKLSPQSLDPDDILLILILWLLYKESGDEEFLITMIAMFLL